MEFGHSSSLQDVLCVVNMVLILMLGRGSETVKEYSLEELYDEIKINPLDEHPKLGIVILEKCRNKGIASTVIKNFAKRYYEENGNEYFLIRISSDNLHNIHVFEKLGARYMGSEDNRYEKLLYDIISMSQILCW